jgi:hypothetical protein
MSVLIKREHFFLKIDAYERQSKKVFLCPQMSGQKNCTSHFTKNVAVEKGAQIGLIIPFWATAFFGWFKKILKQHKVFGYFFPQKLHINLDKNGLG